jgi:hypothetical protein
MYLPVPPQGDCATAWLEAARLVDNQPGHNAHNVVIDVEYPTEGATRHDPVVALVGSFLAQRNKSITCVANTIFPAALYRRYGAPDFMHVFRTRVLPKVRRGRRWSGYYFERMIGFPSQSGEPIDQLSNIVERIRDKNNQSLNKFELSLFDPQRDVDDSPYGGQCLSFLSFKLLPGSNKRLALTAIYRNQYYIEKLLGNLIGLGRLMKFIADEGGVGVGPLTVISTHAEIDHPGKNGQTKRGDVVDLLERCTQARTAGEPVA